MRFGWIVASLAMTACIEGVDPNDCSGPTDACSDGRVCSGHRRCERVEDVRDLEVRWTIDGLAPTPAMPGRCTELIGFALGASGEDGFYSESAVCPSGNQPLLRVPRDFRTVSAAGYRHIGNGGFEVVADGMSEIPIDGDVVVLDIRLR
jgi:hypothetical protein